MIMNVKNIKDPNFMDQLIKFAKVMENDKIQDLKKSNLDCLANVRSCEVTLNQGRKYTKVDYGDSYSKCGMFMIDNATGEIFGINGYGKVNKKHYYGTLDNFESKFWGNYNVGINKNYTRDMQNLLTVAGVVKEMEQPTIKFERCKIILSFATEYCENIKKLRNEGFKFAYNDKSILWTVDTILNRNILIDLGLWKGITEQKEKVKEIEEENKTETMKKFRMIVFNNCNVDQENIIIVAKNESEAVDKIHKITNRKFKYYTILGNEELNNNEDIETAYKEEEQFFNKFNRDGRIALAALIGGIGSLIPTQNKIIDTTKELKIKTISEEDLYKSATDIIDCVNEELEQIEEVEEVKEEKKNSICTVKFVNDKIVVTLNGDLLKQDPDTQNKLKMLVSNGFNYDFNNQMFVADDNDFMKNLLIKLGFLQGELKTVRKQRKEPFQVVEKKEIISNEIVEKNNIEPEAVEQKDDSVNTKNVIFVDFKQAKKKNVEPFQIKLESENHGTDTFNSWKLATGVYNGIIDFLQ